MKRQPLMPADDNNKRWPFAGTMIMAIAIPLGYFLLMRTEADEEIQFATIFALQSALTLFMASILERTFVKNWLPTPWRYVIGFPVIVVATTAYCLYAVNMLLIIY